MSVHDTNHPQPLDTSQVLDNNLTVLISLFNIWDHTHPGFAEIPINYTLTTFTLDYVVILITIYLNDVVTN